MMNVLLNMIKEQFSLNEMPVGEYQKLKAKGMTFLVRQFYAEGFGNVSVMSAKGFFGLMQMDTFIVNPIEKDLPLFSYDRIHAMGNDTLILELYDTLLGECAMNKIETVKNEYSDLPNHDLGKHWYDSIKLKESASKKGKKAQTQKNDEFTKAYFSAYMEGANQLPEVDSTAKKEKASVYVEGLLENGGPSTDVFKEKFGEMKTADLFRRILFGTI
jgi:hypothetical protein